MVDVIISKKNEVYAKVHCDRAIAQELSDFLTFFVPGYTFVPAYRNKIWDGKIRLLNLQTNLLYLGLIPYIEEFCQSRDYTFEYDHTRPDLEDVFSVKLAKEFFTELKLHSRGNPIDVREHQIEAFVHAMQKRRALLLSPTASGKSLIIYLIFRQLLEYQELRGLIIVPTVNLVSQLFSDFEDYSSENGFVVDDNVHKIYQGQSKETNKNLTISTWQSIFKQDKEYFDQFDYVICDEVHLAQANSIRDIMEKLSETKYRIGLTGTLSGMKTHKLVLEGLFGTVKKVISTKELIDKKELVDFNIKCLVLKHSDEVCKLMKSCTYQEEIEYIITNELRNKFIKNLAVSMNNNTLVLFQLVDKHGKILYNLIKNSKQIGDRKVFFVHGGTATDDRENIRKIVEEESNAIIVASFGVYSTGVNIRNLHNIIFASPSKSRVRNLQSIGRGLRQSEGKTKATLYDIADDMRHNKHVNFTLKHFSDRVKIYTEEHFKYKLYKINLKI